MPEIFVVRPISNEVLSVEFVSETPKSYMLDKSTKKIVNETGGTSMYYYLPDRLPKGSKHYQTFPTYADALAYNVKRAEMRLSAAKNQVKNLTEEIKRLKQKLKEEKAKK